ncbi:hypothetical protein C6N75_01360 [Streptomyces solincola]|uniref:Uncharacterized protein n=1 Tax=Streptomyces solincola TaxID=2100817 RepID=A0A2S9Q2W5_9ACTN|nr:hypothetical protein [Streptomyces solincola]PRH80953.1 hypothetical protein C6N75_01360 [Streptomyces solincola]
MAEQHADKRDEQPFDEEAAWAAIVAGYGEEPADPPGAKPFKPVEDLALPGDEVNGLPEGPVAGGDAGQGGGKDAGEDAGKTDKPLGSSVVFAPGVGMAGPRDYEVAAAKDDDLDESDEGHFVPPEPPELPESDAAARFAWLGVVGGPVLMLLAAVLEWDMTWWLTTLCVGGFLGGVATLVARMRPGGDEEDEDPGRGAVV